ncbi:MAG TPA: metallophosphoesterase [Sporichthyaceae bacterium]|nr:metallophosphoesterase [Sporichthyaceae bacterium]
MSPENPLSATEISRRRFLRHTAWAGAAVAVVVTGGVVTTEVLRHGQRVAPGADFHFVQISDSHIGFTGAANADVTATFQQAIDKINSLPDRPDFVIHTGDLTHFTTPAQLDQVKQMLGGLKTGQVLTIPGEHDSTDDTGQKYRAVFGAGSQGNGWYSFDQKGVHFISVVNTIGLQQLGHLGADQLTFIRNDLAAQSSETPIVVFSHIPLFDMYAPWGWGTDDAPEVLTLLKRFGSATCINGHVHQIVTKTEGNVTFHTAAGTAYPLPQAGANNAPAPKPLTLPPGQLHAALGVREIHHIRGNARLAVTESTF